MQSSLLTKAYLMTRVPFFDEMPDAARRAGIDFLFRFRLRADVKPSVIPEFATLLKVLERTSGNDLAADVALTELGRVVQKAVVSVVTDKEGDYFRPDAAAG